MDRSETYIESKERQTRMHRVREVCDQASPDPSHETDETSGNRLDAEE